MDFIFVLQREEPSALPRAWKGSWLQRSHWYLPIPFSQQGGKGLAQSSMLLQPWINGLTINPKLCSVQRPCNFINEVWDKKQNEKRSKEDRKSIWLMSHIHCGRFRSNLHVSLPFFMPWFDPENLAIQMPGFPSTFTHCVSWSFLLNSIHQIKNCQYPNQRSSVVTLEEQEGAASSAAHNM